MVTVQVSLDRNDPIYILDYGHVRYVNSMGSDQEIVDAARQSYGEGTKKSRTDSGLINYLLRNHHDTPFETVEIHLQFKVPIFVARQILRHRLFSVNELSGRYSIMPEEVYIPSLDQICYQSTDNKQGRSGPMDTFEAQLIQDTMREQAGLAFFHYNRLLEKGLARETARMILPLATYTVFGFKANLRTWLHFLHLRMDPHAQWETRQVAIAASMYIKQIAPEAYAAWEEYVQQSVSLSRNTWRIVTKQSSLADIKAELTMLKVSKGEIAEFEKKFQQAA